MSNKNKNIDTNVDIAKEASTRKPAESPEAAQGAVDITALTAKIAELEKQLSSQVVRRADDVLVRLVHKYDNRNGAATSISYGNGKRIIFRRMDEFRDMPLTEFEQEFATSPVGHALLKKRIIIVEGCPKTTSDRLELEVKGEMLKANELEGILDLTATQLVEKYKRVEDIHKRMIIQSIGDAAEANDTRITREKIVKINNLSKEFSEGGKTGLLKEILKRWSDKHDD